MLAAGLLVFFTVNTALVAGAMAVAGPPSGATQAVGTADENLLELATLCVGALVAAVMVVNPWLVLLSVPPLLVLQRAVLVRHLERVASIDAKTGLLNAAAWHARAERAVTRPGRGPAAAAVLVLDLDHFKDVNDTYGHLAGDEVLAAVAEALRAEVREGDLVGRFGGEEFVILLAARPDRKGADALAAAQVVADRIRRRVASLAVGLETPDGPLTVAGLSVSVGAAVRPDGHDDLRTLVHAADTALYAAKRAGRNRVGVGVVPAAGQRDRRRAGRGGEGRVRRRPGRRRRSWSPRHRRRPDRQAVVLGRRRQFHSLFIAVSPPLHLEGCADVTHCCTCG